MYVMSIFFLSLTLFGVLTFSVTKSTEKLHHLPRIISSTTDKDGLPLFRGTIREDERVVQLSEAIKVKDDDNGERGLICGYIIHNSAKKHIPFVVDVSDIRTGLAVVRLRDEATLDYEHRKTYKFAISAFNCGSTDQLSKRAIVHIEVEDINEYSPVFVKTRYNLELEEGRIYDNILKVVAKDSDRSPQFGEICEYSITLGNETFHLSPEGVLSNKIPLERSVAEIHKVVIVAKDCGHLVSETPVMVTIKVIPKCVSGWSGIPNSIEYTPGSGYLKFASSAKLTLCNKSCDITRVSADVTLSSNFIGKGCDRDTFSMHSQRQICGADGHSVELLPSPNAPNSWTRNVNWDEGHEADLMFKFGRAKDIIDVPESSVRHKLLETFTLSTWMRHSGRGYDADDDEDELDTHREIEKEHILCTTDSNEMNRHHYSWYLHGEKMILLWRQEAEDAKDQRSFRASEWRWHLPEINDGAWHHYAITVEFPKVNLYVDGEITDAEKTEKEVVDDWPLHRTAKVKSTKMTIGGCWQGRDKRLKMFFTGYLAGLYLLNGRIESDDVVNCLTKCRENLELESLRKLHSGTTISFTRDHDRVSVSGKTIQEVQDVVRELNYQNARGYPTPGKRDLKIETAISCGKQEGSAKHDSVTLPQYQGSIEVLRAPRPLILLTGSRNIAYSIEDLAKGQTVFSTISLSLKYRNQQSESATGKDKFLIDQCLIRAEPFLDLKIEKLTFPGIDSKLLETSETNEEVVVSGPSGIKDYETLLRNMVYSHAHGYELAVRKFHIICSSQNQRFISNKLLFTVSAIHIEPNPEYKAHLQVKQPSHHIKVPPLAIHKEPVKKMPVTPGFGMIAIIVVCVGFLVFMIVLGIFRIRAYQRRTTVVHVEEKQEMEWDDSPLNITVNPLDQKFGEYDESVRLNHCPASESETDVEDEEDEDEENSSYHDEESSEDEEGNKRSKDLAWDNTTMTF